MCLNPKPYYSKRFGVMINPKKQIPKLDALGFRNVFKPEEIATLLEALRVAKIRDMGQLKSER